jgi:hypothetical protein
MSKKHKLKVFCTITQWLEKHDAELYQALQDLCITQYLKPRNGGGVTFLYPKDKKYKAKIIDNTYSDNAEKIKEAQEVFKSLVVYNYLPTGQDWVSNKQNISNALGFKIKFSNSKGNTVELDGGVKLSLFQGFQARSDRANMSVWEVEKGEIPRDGERAQFQSFENAPVKKGGREKFIAAQREKFGRFIESEFRKNVCTKHDDLGLKIKQEDPYLNALVSLFLWLNSKGKNDILRSLLIVCSPSWKSSFYIVFEPYRSDTDNCLLNNDDFALWQAETCGYAPVNDTAGTYEKMFNKINKLGVSDKCGTPEGRRQIYNMQHKLRTTILALHASPDSLSGKLIEEYSNISDNNELGDIKNVYPEYLAAYYKKSPHAKGIQDTIRYILNDRFYNLMSPIESNEYFCCDHIKLCDFIKIYLNMSVNSKSSLLDSKLHSTTVEFYSGPYGFTRSNFFLYVGCPFTEIPYEVKNAGLSDPTNFQPDDNTLIDLWTSDLQHFKAWAPKSCDKLEVFNNVVKMVEIFNSGDNVVGSGDNVDQQPEQHELEREEKFDNY